MAYFTRLGSNCSQCADLEN